MLVIGEANAIGGPAAGNGNVISGNDQAGVRLTGGATANSVQGNIIGVNASGTGVLGNGIGVHVDGASTNVIGGLAAGAGNEIAFSTTIGVLVGQGSSDNAIFGNAIHQNGTLGIDLVGDGVTANDPGDIDEGANNRTNFPVLSAAAGGVQGTLNSFPDATFRIEFFGNLACDASGNGEGQILLGSTSVTTDATGNATIPLFAAAVDQFVTATATDSSNNTSEFSACVTPLGAAAEIAVSAVDSPDPIVVGGQLSYTVTVTNNGPSPATNVQLSAVWNGPFNVDATSPAGTCEFTPLLTCTFGTLASGATATLGIVGTPGAIGQLGATFTIQADENDPVPANNTVAVNTSVVGGPFSFVVTNTNDSGAGSLRQAILNANASVGADVISFAIPGAGVQTITLASTLPTITDRGDDRRNDAARVRRRADHRAERQRSRRQRSRPSRRQIQRSGVWSSTVSLDLGSLITNAATNVGRPGQLHRHERHRNCRACQRHRHHDWRVAATRSAARHAGAQPDLGKPGQRRHL